MTSQIFIFHGSDTYSSLEKLKAWLAVFKQKYSESSILKLEADEISSDQLWQELESGLTSGSLFDDTKLIIVKRLWQKDKINPQVAEKILTALDQLLEKTFILFWADQQIPANDQLLKKLTANPQVKIECFNKPVTKNEFNLWLEANLKKKNLNLSAQTKEKLAINFGRDLVRKSYNSWLIPYDLGVISYFLDSLAASQSELEVEKVMEKLITPASNFLVFDLTDALLGGNLPSALKSLDFLLANNPPEVIFATITWQFRSILKIRAAMDEGYSTNQIAQITQLSPFVVQKSENLARKLSLEKLAVIYNLFLDFDYKTKTGYDSAWKLEVLVINLCR